MNLYEKAKIKVLEAEKTFPKTICCIGNTGPTGPKGDASLPNAQYYNILDTLPNGGLLSLVESFNNGDGYITNSDTAINVTKGVYYISHVFTADIGSNSFIQITPLINNVIQRYLYTYSNTGNGSITATVSAGRLFNILEDSAISFVYRGDKEGEAINYTISIIKIQ